MDASDSENPSVVLASCLAFLAEKVPDLASVVKAWPVLPEPVKAGILAMVRASYPPRGAVLSNDL